MYLHKAIFAPYYAKHLRDLKSSHNLIYYKLFGDYGIGVPRTEGSGVLWRLESDDLGNPVLLVQSNVMPHWEFAPESLRHVTSKLYNLHLKAGETLHFCLDGNPVKDGVDGRRPLLKNEERLTWIERKISDAGATIQTVNIIKSMARPIKRTVVIQQTRFDGLLIVNDPTKLEQAVQNGIGRAKAYGCGLLSLARQRVFPV